MSRESIRRTVTLSATELRDLVRALTILVAHRELAEGVSTLAYEVALEHIAEYELWYITKDETDI